MNDPTPDSLAERAAEPPEPEPRSRMPGVWLILGGVGVAALGVILGEFARKGLVFVGLGAVGVLIGLGYLYSPWSAEMVAANNDPNGFGKLWRLMPVFWKVWFPLSILAGLAVMFAMLFELVEF